MARQRPINQTRPSPPATVPDIVSGSPDAIVGLGSWLRLRLRTGFVDAALWVLATIGAFVLRFDGAIPSVPAFLAVLIALTALKFVASMLFGLQRHSWRRFGFPDVTAVALAMGTVTLIAVLVAVAIPGVATTPSLPVIDGLLSLGFMFGARAGVRAYAERHGRRARGGRRERDVLVIGAGEAGAIMVREMLRHPETGMNPIGFLDDDLSKRGLTIASVPVLGNMRALEEVLARHPVDEVLVCIPSAKGRFLRNIVDRVHHAAPDVPCRTIPALRDVLSGNVQFNRIRSVTIDDLLRRKTVELDPVGMMSYLTGKRVMVTGAGGSIGSELVRQICAFEPKELILVGRGENSIYQIERELDVDWPGIRYTGVIAQIQNVVRLKSIFEQHRPEVIFHTAAHKHVPLMEQNPEEAVFNNIVGSRNLIELALESGVQHLVNVSTDKAVNPTSVMGATKRIVEMLVEIASRRAGHDQTFVSVRFGNVLGSRGSAVPIFKKQIAAGGPVTVTHPDMVRYFMTIPEASRLVLQAAAQGTNGEIYILDMGEPVKVLDLVTDLIKLSGLEPDVDIPIVFTGTRPGEKLYEELMTDREEASATEHDKILVARSQPIDEALLERTVEELVEASLLSDGDAIRRLLGERIDGAKLKVPSATRLEPVTTPLAS